MVLYVSPIHTAAQFPGGPTLDQKIDIFAARTLGWQLDIAEQVINGKRDPDGAVIVTPIADAGFAVLDILFKYFETTAKYEDGFEGTGMSEEYFGRGVRSVFPDLDNHPMTVREAIVGILYSEGRCGLYHAGMPGGGISLSHSYTVPIRLTSGNRVEVNPHTLPAVLKMHLANYISRLKDPSNQDLRDRFEKRFDYDAKCRWRPKAKKQSSGNT